MHKQSGGYGKLLDAGFDYLTMTVTPKMPHWNQFHGTALDYLSGLETAGQKVVEKSRGGYNGYESNGTYYGERGDSRIWQTSGEQSRNVADFVRANQVAPKITRCDTQITVAVEGDEISELGRMLRELQCPSQRSEKVTARKSAAFYEGELATGLTGGHRTSARYIRAYRADLRHPDKYNSPSIRFECEFKSGRAEQVWGIYRQAVDDSVMAASVVGSEFLRHGLQQPLRAEFAPIPLPPIARNSSERKTVNWLVGFVAPIVARMVRAGYGDELRRAFVPALNPAPQSRERSASLEAERNKFTWEED